MAESAVKSAKKLLRKCKASGTDPLLALLELRNVPSEGIGSSPAQRLHGRRTRTRLPVSTRLLEPRGKDALSTEKERLKERKQRQAQRYDRHAKDLPILKEGDTVRMKPWRHGAKEWEKAMVKERLDERSYKIQTEHGIYRRNRVDLKRTAEQPPRTPQAKQQLSVAKQQPQAAKQQPQVAKSPAKQSTPSVLPRPTSPPTRYSPAAKVTTAPRTTRSGRAVVKPTKLNL